MSLSMPLYRKKEQRESPVERPEISNHPQRSTAESNITEFEGSSISEPSRNSFRPSSFDHEDPLPPPVLAGSSVRGQFYSPRGAVPPPAQPGDENDADNSFLHPLKPASRLEPLDQGVDLDSEGGRKKKKKKRRMGRKNRLAPDPSGEEDIAGDDEMSKASMGSRTPSRPDLFITEQIYTLNELDEDGK